MNRAIISKHAVFFAAVGLFTVFVVVMNRRGYVAGFSVMCGPDWETTQLFRRGWPKDYPYVVRFLSSPTAAERTVAYEKGYTDGLWWVVAHNGCTSALIVACLAMLYYGLLWIAARRQESNHGVETDQDA